MFLVLGGLQFMEVGLIGRGVDIRVGGRRQ